MSLPPSLKAIENYASREEFTVPRPSTIQVPLLECPERFSWPIFTFRLTVNKKVMATYSKKESFVYKMVLRPAADDTKGLNLLRQLQISGCAWLTVRFQMSEQVTLFIGQRAIMLQMALLIKKRDSFLLTLHAIDNKQ